MVTPPQDLRGPGGEMDMGMAEMWSRRNIGLELRDERCHLHVFNSTTESVSPLLVNDTLLTKPKISQFDVTFGMKNLK